MRGTRLLISFLFVAAIGCRSGKTVPEPGAVLLHVKCAAGSPTPDELRAWVYDDSGGLWDGMRIPASGPLAITSPQDLGTVLIQPGAFQGKLRIHLKGLATGQRILDGTLIVASTASGDRIFDILLSPSAPADADGDGVPDAIDDCLDNFNPTQGGCVAPVARDAASDAVPDMAEVAPSTTDSAVATPDSLLDTDGGTQVGAEVALHDGPAALAGDADVGVTATEGGPDVPAVGDVQPVRGETGSEAAADAKDVSDRRLDVTPEVAPPVDAPAGDVVDAATDLLDSAGGATCVDAGPCNLPQGTLCAANSQCASGACTDGVCCTNSCLGPCRSCNQPSATGVCQGYAAATDPEVECPNGSACNGVGACGPAIVPNLPNGQLCSSPGQCLSRFCADGVCCDSACTAPCQACGTGTCLAVKRADDVPECTGTTTCNPKGNCVAR